MKILKLTAIVMLFWATSSLAAPNKSSEIIIEIDGSSTVYPISEAVAEEFRKVRKDVKITIGFSGTGGGFKKFCAGETDISNASRPIKEAELELCKKNGVEYIELPVAYDALSVVVNSQNDWAKTMTVAELKKIWEPSAQGKVTNWNQIRAEWPNAPLELYGPGVDSGTYDYFTEAVVGQEHASRGDFTSSEDDNVLVQGVSLSKNALGFFGLAYYIENQDKLKALAVDDQNDANGKGGQMPSIENVVKGVYQPLARPLLIYIRKDSAEKTLVREFINFYIDNSSKLATEVGYVQLNDDVIKLVKERFNTSTTGSVFAGSGFKVGVSLVELLQ